jgi:hypothetical protein
MASRFFRAFPGSRGPPPHWQNDEWRLYRACKGAPDTGRQATRVGTFSPSLVIRARGCFLARVLRLRFCRRKLRPLSIDPRWCVVCMGRNHCPTLLADIGGGMITAWSVIALSQPDLFSPHMVQDGSPPTRRASAKEAPADTASQRHVLPRDLPNAVKYLTDTELDLLITTSVQEAKRRGRLPPSAQPNPTNEPVAKQSSSRHKGQTEIANVSLTRGQVNAVRAATKAGIKRSQIARQFGISQSDVRKVLASDTATRRAT